MAVIVTSFEAARNIENPLDDDTITAILDSHMAKSVLDGSRARPGDFDMAREAESLGELRDSFVGMIKKNLHIWSGASTDEVSTFLDSLKDAYFRKLKSDNDLWKHGVKSVIEGKTVRNLARVGRFSGLTVGSGGYEVDLTEAGLDLPGIRSNITVDGKGIGQFIFWETAKTANDSFKSIKQVWSNRIYLNPKTDDLVEVFEALMKKMEQDGFKVKAKVLDRSREYLKLIRQDAGTVRSDSIVLYCESEEANAILKSVIQLYKDHEASFVGRSTPVVPLEIAPGLAIGDEPPKKGESLTSHRACVVEAVAEAVREVFGEASYAEGSPARTAQAVAKFRELLAVATVANGIDPNNLAFNKKRATHIGPPPFTRKQYNVRFGPPPSRTRDTSTSAVRRT